MKRKYKKIGVFLLPNAIDKSSFLFDTKIAQNNSSLSFAHFFFSEST